MSIFIVLLVVLSAIFHALRNFLTKQAGDKQAFVWWYEVFALIFFLPLFIYYLSTHGLTQQIGYFLCLLSGFTHFLYWLFLAKSYEEGDLSHVYPIMRSSPALVLIISIIFLGEEVSLLGVCGILLVAFGVYTINMKKFSIDELLSPIRSLFKDRSTQYALLTLLSIALYSLIDKVTVQYVHPVILIYALTLIAFVLFTPYVFRVKGKTVIWNEWKNCKKSIMVAGFLVIFGYILILYAFTVERLSYIVGLRQLSIVFAVLLGGLILQEKYKMVRMVSAITIFAGAFFISIAK